MDLERADVLVDILRLLPPASLAVSRSVCTGWRAVIDDHRLLRVDVLVKILCLLPPRSLAVCRSVGTGWHAIIDDHRLLRADLLPLSLHGIIYQKKKYPNDLKLFSRLSTSSTVTTRLDYLGDPKARKKYRPKLVDCCNGLLLLDNYVVNPATRQWVSLPPPPLSCSVTACESCLDVQYLAFDPTLSPHYRVFSIPRIPNNLPSGHISKHTCNQESVSAMEWPPSPYMMHVFSSKTMCWEERSFRREGRDIGTVKDVKSPYWRKFLHQAAYWRGALYVLCENYFVLRISLSYNTYTVIKLPTGSKRCDAVRLGKSNGGVYCATRCAGSEFQVWFLDEASGHMYWRLKNMINPYYDVRNYRTYHAHGKQQSCDQVERLLQNDINLTHVDDGTEALAEDDFDWDSDNEDLVDVTYPRGVGQDTPYFECLGFHPYKEIAIFHGSNTTLAYYLNISKVRYLGKMKNRCNDIDEFFPYSPYWKRDLPGSH